MTYDITLQNTLTPSITVTDQNGKPVPASGYTGNVAFSDPTVLAVDTNPTVLVPQKLGSTTVQWTIIGKGSYSGTITLAADTVNVNPIPLANAAISYTVQ